MKIKVSFFSSTLIKEYFYIVGIISAIVTIASVFITIPDGQKTVLGIRCGLIFALFYVALWLYVNYTKCAKININNSNVTVRIGDIFREKGLKVIAFNEYFDTTVNENIIASSSLNGQFIKKYVSDVNDLDNAIATDKRLAVPERQLEVNNTRVEGKKQKYRLGSVLEYNGYLLTAFTKFDSNNRAYLSMNDYINCLLNFWNEVDIIYANRSVVVPLLGTGITRLSDNNDMTEQEKLELLLWSFKISRIKFTYPADVTIVIHKSIQDKINFHALKTYS